MIWYDYDKGMIIFHHPNLLKPVICWERCPERDVQNAHFTHYEPRGSIPWCEIWQDFLLDYTSYLIESAIDSHLADEEILLGVNTPVLDRPLADIIEENTVNSTEDEMTNREKQLIRAAWIDGALWTLNEFSIAQRDEKGVVEFLGIYRADSVENKIFFRSDAIFVKPEATAQQILNSANKAIREIGHGDEEAV